MKLIIIQFGEMFIQIIPISADLERLKIFSHNLKYFCPLHACNISCARIFQLK
jgi:hypothetical protein